MKDDLAKRLRSMRNMLGLTQSALLSAWASPKPTSPELEKGHQAPSLDVLEKLCSTLNCSADYLLGLRTTRATAPCARRRCPAT